MNLVCSRGSFGGDLEKEVNSEYKFYVDLILRFEKVFNYSMDIASILDLPYCLFQDLLIKGSERKKVESNATEQQIRNMKYGKRK